MFEIKNKLFLAPLAGITDTYYRQICKDLGADVMCTELISVDGLNFNSINTYKMLEFVEDEHPIGIQLFGSKPKLFENAIKKINKLKPDYFDLNLGCSVKKVNKNGAGAILLNDLKTVKEIIYAMKSNTSIPISAKIRLGWKENIGIEIAQILEEAGVEFITVHGRIAKQQFSGNADWNTIKKIKESVNIPVIGNGDIKTPMDVIEKQNFSKTDAIMIGRAALGNPWIFSQIKEYIKFSKVLTIPSTEDKINILRRHYMLVCGQDKNIARIKIMRKHFHWYTRGIKNIKYYKNRVNEIISYDEIMKLLDQILKEE